MNRLIGELTDLVLALTQQISSNQREGNEINTVTTNANSRFDTRIVNLHPTKGTHWLCFQIKIDSVLMAVRHQ